MDQKPFLNVDEAASFLNYSKFYLYRLVQQKRISSYRPSGGRLLFKLNELEEFVLRGRRPAIYEGGSHA